MKISDYKVYVVLPASGDCFGINVMSKKETRIPRAQCEEIVKRAVIITSENWKLIRGDIQTNCQTAACEQLTGRWDSVFLAVDRGLQPFP